MDSDACEIAEFYEWSEPVARRDHLCCECQTPIRKGEKHFSCRGKWGDDFQAYRQHLKCMEACMLIRDKFNGGDCIGFGELFNAWHEIKTYYSPQHDRVKDIWKQLRSLIAAILRHQRRA